MSDLATPLPPALVQRARGLVVPHRRRVLGITGAPGSGKSTLAASLAALLSPAAAVLPMDGFHLANAELERLRRRDRKGAPDTFDANAYVSVLRRLRSGDDSVVHAPAFDRVIEEPVADEIEVRSDVPLVITEGNYLLLDEGPWSAVRALLDEVWYLELPTPERVRRLIARHVQFGKTSEQAADWVARSDERNAELIAATKSRADLVVSLG